MEKNKMSKEILTEGFVDRLIGLLVKSAVTKRKPKALKAAISKDKELNQAFSDLEDATDRVRRWAEEQRAKSPEYAAIDDALAQLVQR